MGTIAKRRQKEMARQISIGPTRRGRQSYMTRVSEGEKNVSTYTGRARVNHSDQKSSKNRRLPVGQRHIYSQSASNYRETYASREACPAAGSLMRPLRMMTMDDASEDMGLVMLCTSNLTIKKRPALTAAM